MYHHTMTWLDRASLFSTFDYGAVLCLLVVWLMIGVRIEHPPAKRPSTSQLMADYRREWMRQMITREPRIFDAQVVSSLRQGTAFFASTAVIALGGVLALLGNAERVNTVAGDLVQSEAPIFVWEIKLLLVLGLLANAFLKFVWSNRLFGYASVVMGSVPNDVTDRACLPRAAKAAEINIIAAKNFNRGLRSVYFALAATAWLAGPWALGAATLFTLGVVWRREFASKAREVLLDTDTDTDMNAGT